MTGVKYLLENSGTLPEPEVGRSSEVSTTQESNFIASLLPLDERKLIGLLFAEARNRSLQRNFEKASGFPAKPERPQDGHLAGLLTYASAISSAFPVFPVASAEISAITVARQWRILTALPNARRRIFIDEGGR
jgi:hypothetical protein